MTTRNTHDGKSLRSQLDRKLTPELAGAAAFDEYTRHLFSRDASMYSILPLGVVFPKTVEDVAYTVRTAAEYGVSVVPRGAGTSLAGQTVGPGLVMDFSRYMRSIVELDPQRRVAVVEAGAVQDQLNTAAAVHGLMFGPDTSTGNRATVGGMIGNNSCGSGSLVHGATVDHVLELQVVLADGSQSRLRLVNDATRVQLAHNDTLEGSIYRRLPRILQDNAAVIETGYPKFWRQSCGYQLRRLTGGQPFNLAKLVVGSEGTLAIVTHAMVSLVPKPRHTVIAVGHFDSVQAAIAATGDALSLEPAQVELMDRTILELARRKMEYASLSALLRGEPSALLFVSFSSDAEPDLLAKLDGLTELWAAHNHGYHTLRAVTAAQQAALLKVRKSGLGLLMAASEGTRRPLAFVEDTAVDPAYLVEYTRRFKQILDKYGLVAGFYGHCSVGCLHIRPFVDVTDPQQRATMRIVAEEVKDLVAEYGGVNSSEHGDGLARSEFNREIFGDQLYEAMRQVKRLFDPGNVLNPGKIVDAPSMTENLRDPILPPPGPLNSRLSFEAVGGMRAAADRCMNIGLCRKTTSGVMCPSYQVTHNEQDSVRGRANALVKALSAPDPRQALTDRRLHEILDLCLMCNACKTECPLSVDMASLKAEALSHHHDRYGTPLRSRIFGAARTVNRVGSALAPLSNIPLRIGPVRRSISRSVGIHPDRPLPLFVHKNLARWHRLRRPNVSGGSLGSAIFIADSFTTFTEPQIGRAAIELLEEAGWRVQLESSRCCGRSSLSKGLIDDAKTQAKMLVDVLAAEPTSLIVGCEPSCLMMLRDDHTALLPGDLAAKEVGDRVRQVEELLIDAIDSRRLALRSNTWLNGKSLLYHGHCHQKAAVGTTATMELLRRIPGVEVHEIDSGCCGMAGSFGFETEHYDVSMRIGDDRLFPAVNCAPDNVVVASGVSCRQQIWHGTGRTAWHPVQLIRTVLDEKVGI
ncbi:FAD-binding and (Fe-S)-binding domain-containing protein [Mycobacteroides abscessus]|uniref:FAD-binding and (Fe-S)-binding domain-containing protein n=1 Tax=Mycobacteroides abscessus TaxID=36809 RepID=UPI0009A5E392|nr:FAD-binding and (Fe-S)-binding domain-containing protein [Mycobacteroides abscessus]SLF47408.1 D-lactate dehydrogenase [Mycobacteroides abscessus subsp. abscessus]